MLLFGPLIQKLYFEHSGKDDTRLVRCYYMKFCGSERIKTRIVCGYNPCYYKKNESNTSYQKHHRFFITNQKKRQGVPKETLHIRPCYAVKALAEEWGLTNFLFGHK